MDRLNDPFPSSLLLSFIEYDNKYQNGEEIHADIVFKVG